MAETSDDCVGDAFRCCGVTIDASSFDGAVADVLQAKSLSSGRSVHLCNAYTLSLAQRDEDFSDLLNRGDLNYADGMPLVWAGRRAGFDAMDERVYGPDLMEAVFDRGRAVGLRHYLYGATDEVLAGLEAALLRSFPGTTFVGRHAPPFRPLTDDEKRDVISRVRAAQPDVVWVGLGTPLQDRFVDEFRDELPATLVAVGAAFDYLSGNKTSAPRWMQRSGLEWLYRLAKEPKRMWRRYLVGNAVFLYGLVRGGVKRV